MPKKAYARRYAQAVFELALEKNELERWESDLEKISEAVGVEAFLAVLENPKIKLEDKSRLITGSLGEINPLALNLLLMLIEKSAVSMIRGIVTEFQQMVDDYHGVQTAEVVTAVPLEESEKEKLTGSLSEIVGKKIEMKAEVDPEILGGIIARVGGKLLDGSTRSRLVALKRELVGTERKKLTG